MRNHRGPPSSWASSGGLNGVTVEGHVTEILVTSISKFLENQLSVKLRVTGVHVNQFQVTHIKIQHQLLRYEKDDLIVFIHHIQVVMM
jgi:hypothetical protein